MLDLIPEYQRSRLAAVRERDRLKILAFEGDDVARKDAAVWAEMVSELSYAIEWLSTGREPKYADTFEKKQKGKSLYDRRVLIDMELFPCLDLDITEPESVPEPMSDERKRLVLEIMAVLSERERTVFILHNAYLLTFDKIGKELGISRQNACKYANRAKRKVAALVRSQGLEFPSK